MLPIGCDFSKVVAAAWCIGLATLCACGRGASDSTGGPNGAAVHIELDASTSLDVNRWSDGEPATDVSVYPDDSQTGIAGDVARVDDDKPAPDPTDIAVSGPTDASSSGMEDGEDAQCEGGGCCVPSCDGKTCGPDGCGGVCGVCSGGDYCADDGSGCCGHVDAGSCDTAWPLDGSLGDTASIQQSFVLPPVGSTPACVPSACELGNFNHVYALESEQPTTFSVSLTTTTLGVSVGVMHDCGPTASCSAMGVADVWTGAVERVFVLPAGATAFIGVRYSDAVTSGSYELSVERMPCQPSCFDGLGACGDDGCGGSCGDCGSSTVCAPAGLCVVADPDCDSYCQEVAAHCTGDRAQYSSYTVCLQQCEALVGSVGATAAGNPLACRLKHAAWAAVSSEHADAHCRAAGPTGDGACGSWCDVYCHLAETACPSALAPYDSPEACHSACAALSLSGETGQTNGDSVQCRVAHLLHAASGAPEVYCPNAHADGGEACTSGCPEPAVTVGCGESVTLPWPTGASQLDASACGPPGTGAEQVVEIVLAQSAVVTVSEDVDVAGMHLVAVDSSAGTCGTAPASCLASDHNQVSFQGTAGDRFDVVLEAQKVAAADAATAEVTLDVSCCFPVCEGYVCGDDGCGGTCGVCGAGEVCSGTQTTCCAAVEGNTCTNPWVVDFGLSSKYHHSATLTPQGTVPSCDDRAVCGLPDGGLDHIFELTGVGAATYSVSLESSAWMALRVVGDCSLDPACLGKHHAAPVETLTSLEFGLEHGETIYIVVDRHPDDPGSDGGYTLSMERTPCSPNCDGLACGTDGCGGTCGTCQTDEQCSEGQCVGAAGLSCADAILIDTLPYEQSHTTAGTHDHVQCGLAGSHEGELTYRLTAPQDGVYRAVLDPVSPAALYLRSSCGEICSDSSVALPGMGLAPSTATLHVSLTEGETVYLVVDGYQGATGAFELSVELE